MQIVSVILNMYCMYIICVQLFMLFRTSGQGMWFLCYMNVQNCIYTLLIDKLALNFTLWQVFDWTRTVLSSEYLSSIPSTVDRSAFFKKIADRLTLVTDQNETNGHPAFQGQWINIVKAEVGRKMVCVDVYFYCVVYQ